MVKIEIDGQIYEGEEGETILEIAKDNNIEIPTLCNNKALGAYGSCRLCIVELVSQKGSQLVTACTYPISDGLKIISDSEKIMKSRKLTIELLLSRCPEEEKLIDLAKEYGIKEPRFKLKDDNCILCGLCVRMCERMGVQAINFQNRGIDRELGTPYLEQSKVCITCGACAEICPTSRFTKTKVERISGKKPIPILSEFDEGTGTRHSIYIPFPQSVPKIPVIDKERCVYYKTGNCKTCKEFCEADAITYDQEDELKEIDVGSIILTTGFKSFDPTVKQEYGYGRYPNVVTSLEFERFLNASGPTGGHVEKPSDHKTPKKIAFIQCVGSRDQKTNPYCSSVCCTYAIKEAIIAQEHTPGLQTYIFAMDERTFGRGFEDYRIRAEKEYGVHIVRNSRVSFIEETKDKTLLIKYIENGKIKEEEFDMAILSIGLEPSESTKEMAKKLGLKLNEYGFCETNPFKPLTTSQPGIFVSGVFSGPKDIPETVAQASAAAAKASSIIASERNKLVTDKKYPKEIDVTLEEPRIGVLVCHCGINIGGTVDVAAVTEYAKKLPYVVYADNNLYTCSPDTQKEIRKIIEEHKLNRIVVASCTPRTHEPLFQDTIREAGLNPYLFEMANIRDQCSWVHMKEPEKATLKSKELVKMAVAKAALLQPLYKTKVETINTALIIGGGLAGMTAALELANQGYLVDLIEKTDKLGGHLNKLVSTVQGENPQDLLKNLLNQVKNNKKITVHKNAELEKIDGYIGNFKSALSNGKIIEHGVIIVATGGLEYKPVEYSYGKHPNIMTQQEFDEKLEAGKIKAKNIAIIHCVGARDDNNTECGRICCSKSMDSALKIKEKLPDANVFSIFRDIRTYGFKEKSYQDAGEKGVVFIRRNEEDIPEVNIVNNKLELKVRDDVIDRQLILHPDIIVLSNAIVADPNNEKLAKLLKVPLGKDKFFLEAHVKLRPLDFATEGIYVCGLAQGPKFIDETISQACGAVSRACTILSKDILEAGGVVSSVNEELCGGCGTCETICPYSAIRVDDSDPSNLIAKVNEILCKGCGTCVGGCPEKAISMKGFSKKQIQAQIAAMAEGD